MRLFPNKGIEVERVMVFEDGLTKECAYLKGQIQILREKYTSEIILTSMNNKKDETLATARAYNKLQKRSLNLSNQAETPKVAQSIIVRNCVCGKCRLRLYETVFVAN